MKKIIVQHKKSNPITIAEARWPEYERKGYKKVKATGKKPAAAKTKTETTETGAEK